MSIHVRSAGPIGTCLVRGVLAVAVAVGLAPSVNAQADGGVEARTTHVRSSPRVATLSGFVENRGQWPADVRFLAREGGIEAVLLDDALVLHPMPRRVQRSRLDEMLASVPGFGDPLEESQFAPPPPPEPVPGPPLTIRFPGAGAVEGEGALPTRHHFLLGTGSTRNVLGYERVVYREVAPGIDCVVRTDGGRYAYDLHVAAGADLGALSLELDGATSAELLDDGVLALETSAGRVEMRIGASWEVDPATGERLTRIGRFRAPVSTDGRLRIGVEAHGRDPSRAFVLDPTLVYATYVGSTGQDVLREMAVGPDGAVYLVVDTGFAPTTPGAYQRVQVGGLDAWAGKLSPDGTTLEWATYLGGSATDSVAAVGVDQDGTVVINGQTWSPDFPVTPDALDTVNENAPSKSDIYVTRLTPDGSGIVWSTFFGGPDHDGEGTVALFPGGDVLVYGQATNVLPAPTPGAIDPVFVPGKPFMTRISADGTQLGFHTYFAAGVNDIAFDADCNIYVTGGAGSLFTLTTPGAYKETVVPGTFDGQVTKMNPFGTQVIWSTFLGGDADKDFPTEIELDAAHAVYVAGWTTANDFPITSGVPGTNALNGFATKLLPGGSDLVWSRVLSACCAKSTFFSGLAVDPAGCPIISGDSNSGGFPTTPDAFQPTYNGSSTDAHLTKLDALGESLVYSTYFGGGGGEFISEVGLDAANVLHLVLQTTSGGLTTTPGANGSEYLGGGDPYVASFDMPVAPWRVLGGGIAGTHDTPNLAGAGDLTPGSPTRLSVRGGAPSSAALLTVGYPAHQLTGAGGPSGLTPSGLGVSLTTSAQGSLDLSLTWPALPPGVRLTAQVWIQDPSAPGGWSATNKLRLISK